VTFCFFYIFNLIILPVNLIYVKYIAHYDAKSMLIFMDLTKITNCKLNSYDNKGISFAV